MHVLKVIFILLEVLILFNLLIFVHELGHFLAARWRGLNVDRFAIWFGKPIWKRKIGGVEYVLGSIPAGGYVSLPQMAPMEVIEGKHEERAALPPVSALDKIIVAFAGPLFSFGLAIVFAVVVWGVGRPVSESEATTVIGYVDKDGPADKAGLLPGDKILEVDSKPVKKFGGMGESVTWRIVRSEGDTIPIKFERGGQIMERDVSPVRIKTKGWQRKSLRQILIEGAQTPVIAEVVTNSPAALAGLKVGDEILQLNGRPVIHYAEVGQFIEKNGAAPVRLEVGRDNKQFPITVTPEVPLRAEDEKPRLGVVWAYGGRQTLARPGPVEQVRDSVNAMVDHLRRPLLAQVRYQGPAPRWRRENPRMSIIVCSIANRAGDWLSGSASLMNVNLALLNLLPIPVLDGGHITLAARRSGAPQAGQRASVANHSNSLRRAY